MYFIFLFAVGIIYSYEITVFYGINHETTQALTKQSPCHNLKITMIIPVSSRYISKVTFNNLIKVLQFRRHFALTTVQAS